MTAKRFVLVGHAGFYNRGCEAFVRMTVHMLREKFPGCEITLVSGDAENDRHCPRVEDVEILDKRVARWSGTWLGWQMRKLLARDIPSKARLPRAVRRAILEADAVMQVGGDNLTSDYGLGPNSPMLGPNKLALEAGIPLVVWGASIGPFDSPALENLVLDHLHRAALVTARESITVEYLRENGVVHNVVHVADPAMILEPEDIDLSPFWPDAERVVALNVSPLSCRFRRGGDHDFGRKLVRAIVEEVESWDGWGVLLVPHVIKPPHNDDYQFMAEVLESMGPRDAIRIVPPGLDAGQMKYIISRSDILMAARTHATIAAFSSGVPTISLAYSRKAHGINIDLFGSDEWLLDIRTMADPDEAIALLHRLAANRKTVAAHLKQRIPAMREAAERGIHALARALDE